MYFYGIAFEEVGFRLGEYMHVICPPNIFFLSRQGKEEALLTSYCSPANPPDMSGLDQACQEMRDQVGIEKWNPIGN